ncbi:hypothetical protein AAVH_22337 [Aphelenchoides avenae]|nr:hypothetical protein AAVH_22337 [Aphelenchus avenae]
MHNLAVGLIVVGCALSLVAAQCDFDYYGGFCCDNGCCSCSSSTCACSYFGTDDAFLPAAAAGQKPRRFTTRRPKNNADIASLDDLEPKL